MKVQRIDHVGINVENLGAAKEFFLALGMEAMGEMEMQGELVEKVVGLKDVRDTFAMLHVPGSEAMIELIQYHSPKDEQGIQKSQANTLGMRHICLAVDDLDASVAAVKKHGGELVGEIQNYKDMYKLCYVRGPEGIILELAEKLESSSKLFE